MQTITLEINNDNALKTIEALADKHFISIVDKTNFDSPAIPGKALNIAAFRNWISNAENMPTISLTDAKSKWAGKKKQLTKLSK